MILGACAWRGRNYINLWISYASVDVWDTSYIQLTHEGKISAQMHLFETLRSLFKIVLRTKGSRTWMLLGFHLLSGLSTFFYVSPWTFSLYRPASSSFHFTRWEIGYQRDYRFIHNNPDHEKGCTTLLAPNLKVPGKGHLGPARVEGPFLD